MIPVTNEQVQAYLSDVSHKEIRITFPDYLGGYEILNRNIDAESLLIDRSIMDTDELEIVGCISTFAQITIHDVDGSDNLVGQLMFIDINADNTGWLRLFNGNVDSVEKGSNRTVHTIKAYDALHGAMSVDVTSFYNNHLATTLKELLFEVLPPWDFNHDMLLPNGYMLMPCGTIDKVEKMSKYDLLRQICQIAGVFGYITGDNKFNIYAPGQQDGHNIVNIPKYRALDYETFETAELTHLTIKDSDADPGMTMSQESYIVDTWTADGDHPDNLTFASAAEYTAYDNLHRDEHTNMFRDDSAIGAAPKRILSKEYLVYTSTDEFRTQAALGIAWDYPIEKCIEQALKGTGILIEYTSKTTRAVIAETKKRLLAKGWNRRIGNIITGYTHDRIIARDFVDDCISIWADMGMYAKASGDSIKIPAVTIPSAAADKFARKDEFAYCTFDIVLTTSTREYIHMYSKDEAIIGDVYIAYRDTGNGTYEANAYLSTDYPLPVSTARVRHASAYHETPRDRYYNYSSGSFQFLAQNILTCADGKTYYYANMIITNAGTVNFSTEAQIINSREEFEPLKSRPLTVNVKNVFEKPSSVESRTQIKLYPIEQAKHNIVDFAKGISWNGTEVWEGNTPEVTGSSGQPFSARWFCENYGKPSIDNPYTDLPWLTETDNYVWLGRVHTDGSGGYYEGFTQLYFFEIPANARYVGFDTDVNLNTAEYADADAKHFYCLFYDENRELITEYGKAYYVEVNPKEDGSIAEIRRFNTPENGLSFYDATEVMLFVSVFDKIELPFDGLVKDEEATVFPRDKYSTSLSTYGASWQSYDIAFYSSISPQTNSFLKLGKGETQSEVWSGTIAGPANTYIVKGNIFWIDNPAKYTVLFNLFNEIVYFSGYQYRPFTASNPFLPFIECGDQMVYEDSIDGELTFRVFSRSISGIQSMTETNSAKGKQFQDTFVSDLGVKLLDDTRQIAREAKEEAEEAQQQIVVIERDYATKEYVDEHAGDTFFKVVNGKLCMIIKEG